MKTQLRYWFYNWRYQLSQRVERRVIPREWRLPPQLATWSCVRVTPAAAGLQVGERLIGRERYLMVVNTSPHPVTARFELADGERARRVALRFEPAKEIQLQDGRAFVDELPGHWARVYRLELAPPTACPAATPAARPPSAPPAAARS